MITTKLQSRAHIAGVAVVITMIGVSGLTACKSGENGSAAATSTVSGNAPDASTSASAAPTSAATESANASTTAAQGVAANSVPVGQFHLTPPEGFTQNTDGQFPYPVVRLVPNGANGDTDDIIVFSVRGTEATPEKVFSNTLDVLRKTYPSCKLPTGASTSAEAIATGFTANYVVYSCPDMPMKVVNFTSRGPNGLQLAGTQQSTTDDTTTWKKVVGSVVKG